MIITNLFANTKRGHKKGSPISVSGSRRTRQAAERISVKRPFFIKSCFCPWPVRTAFKARFVPVVTSSPSEGGEFFVRLSNDGQGALVGVEDGVQPLRFAERIARQGGG